MTPPSSSCHDATCAPRESCPFWQIRLTGPHQFNFNTLRHGNECREELCRAAVLALGDLAPNLQGILDGCPNSQEILSSYPNSREILGSCPSRQGILDHCPSHATHQEP